MDATAYRRAVTRQMVKDGLHLTPFHAEAAAAGHPLAVDIAWERPTIAEIKATGATGVLRYFSTDPTKNLRAQEVVDYTAAGLSIGSVWETTTGRATEGYQAGVDDAKTAAVQRRSCGLPDTHRIHFAVDGDYPWAAVLPYFQGAVSVIGKQFSGDYGGFHIVEGAAAWGLLYNWQTLAWSGGLVSRHATLYQYGATAINGAADLNYILAPDWGQYPEADMAFTDADADVLLNHRMPGYAGIPQPGGKPPYIPTVGECINGTKQADDKVDALTRQVLQLEKQMTELAAGLPAMLTQALAEALVHVDVTVTGPTVSGV